MSQFYTYMVECADGSLYTGWTVDLKQRVAAKFRAAPNIPEHAGR